MSNELKRILLRNPLSRSLLSLYRLFSFSFVIFIPSTIFHLFGFQTLIGFRGIGDICYEMMFINEYKSLVNKKIRVVSTRNKKQVFNCYPQISRLSFVTDRMNRFLSKGTYFGKLPKWGGVIYTLHYKRRGVTTVQRVKDIYGLSLDQDYAIVYPFVQKTINHKLISTKSIFININSNFYKSILIENFILSVARQLSEKYNYTIYFNGAINYAYQKSWYSTIKWNLPYLYNNANQFEAILSIRTGLLDFIINTNSKIFCFYDSSEKGKMLNRVFSLSDWKSNSFIEEIIVERQNVSRFVEYLIRTIEASKDNG